ncbi:MAG: NAD-dependent epimerase/dehydratase family protein [Candidatus Lokiarchaeota archaeon]|nr:NAD-dependent epimerase/dehydratase family protein [Candidatus Lokiarchaeota archaeon]
MKILVTGASGFIGNYVINYLIKTNNEIIATSRNIKKARDFSWFNKIEYIPCDLNNKKKNYFNFFNKPDILIHLSWEGLPKYKELFHFEKNLINNYYFIKNLIRNGLNDISITGTCFEYGMQSGVLKEDIKTEPITSYGIAKDSLRRFIEKLNEKYRFNYKWIRLFYLYGQGQNPKSLIPQLKKAIDRRDVEFNMSGGEQLRDYLEVEKAAEYVCKIALQNEINGAINCCSGSPISIRNLVERIIEINNSKIKLNLGYYPYPDYVPMAFWGDNSKLNKILKLN